MVSQQRYQAIEPFRKAIKSSAASRNNAFDGILKDGTNFLANLHTVADANATMNACAQTLREVAETSVDEDDDNDEEILILILIVVCIYTILKRREQAKIKIQKRYEITREERYRTTREDRWNTQKRERLVRLRARNSIRLQRIRDTHTKQLVGQPLHDRSTLEADSNTAIMTQVS